MIMVFLQTRWYVKKFQTDTVMEISYMIEHNSNQMPTSLPGSYITAAISMLVVPLHEILVPLLVTAPHAQNLLALSLKMKFLKKKFLINDKYLTNHYLQ